MPSEIYSKTVQLNFTQCYANGALKYSELSNLLQLTASEHAELLGFGYREMARNFQSWVLSRVRIEIEELPKFLQEITIQTWIQDFLGNRSVRNFEVYLNERKIISATTYWAVFNIKERKSENLTAKVDPNVILHEKTSTRIPFQRVEIQRSYQRQTRYIPKLSDLDIVYHVNNVKYTDWCLDQLSESIVFKETFKSMDLNYIKELTLGQEVDIRYIVEDNQIHFSINRGDKTIFLMDIVK